MKYNVIYADPPWSYDNKKTGGSHESAAGQKYSTMTTDEICAMNVPAEKNCVLFLWATVPLLPEAMMVVDAWGFRYKTMITWRKIMSLGMGYWFRGQCEHLIVAVKGKVTPFRQQVANYYESEYDIGDDQVYQCKVGKHSQKPHHFRELIEKAVKVSFEEPKMLELFARDRNDLFPEYEYKNWDTFGNQVTNSITI
jgi:N6-adenosine-specific RNA methylase IME4